VDAYLSGIIAGILEGTGFSARVTAHSVALEEGEVAPYPNSMNSSSAVSSSTSSASLSSMASSYLPPRKEKTVFLVKFAPSVLARDSNLM
jgi:hypothetical protein